jgi:cold shock CspA family protein
MSETGTVVFYNCKRGGMGFVRSDADGARVFIGGTQLAKVGIKRLAAGDTVSFDRLADRFGGTDRAVNVRVIYA